MLEARYRQHYQRYLIDPILNLIPQFIFPYQISIIAGILGLWSVPAMMYQHPWLAIALLIASGYCDTLDGSLARHRHTVSVFGALLDIMNDRLVELAVIIGLFVLAPQHRALLCLLMLGSILICATSFLAVGIFNKNRSQKSFDYSPGIAERPEAFILFVLMIALPAYFTWLATVFICLLFLAASIRIYQFYLNQRQQLNEAA